MTCPPCTLRSLTCIFSLTEEVKGAVDLIPKPKYSILLPVPESSKDGCIRCAVVGSGGILNNSKMGKEIDSHDYVFRVNGAVTRGYEEDVGNRTSVYVHTAFSLYASILTLKQYGFHNIPQDEVSIFYNFACRPLKYFNGNFNESRFYYSVFCYPICIVHILVFENYLKMFYSQHQVDVYGFITEDHHKYSNYYYEKLKKTSVIFFINHDYGLEIKTWKELHDSGIIRLFQRH
uniref:alpha-N-acetylgalactosaminide alpha-2,6-sialyltransferase n=1 Tax=Sinocyclocheilus grahami TaxID=75366 RepID=A0A672K368_SINGR